MVTRIVPDTHATIAAALAASGAGDTVQIRTGTYAEGDLTRAASGIIVESHPDNVTPVYVDPPGGTSNGFRWFTDWTIRGSSASPIIVRNAAGAALTHSGAVRNGVTVQWCEVRTCGGIGIGPVGSLSTVDRCVVSRAGANGIAMDAPATGTTVVNCLVRDTTGTGIYVTGVGSQVLHSTAARCTVHGIQRGAGAAVRNCVAWGNTNRGVFGTNAFVAYTISFANTAGNFDAPTGPGCAEVDPGFVDAAANDFEPLGTASAMVDAGIDAGVTTSLNDVTRPEGTGYDIGPYELAQLDPRGVVRAWCHTPREVRVLLTHPPAQYGPYSCLTRGAWALSLASGVTRAHGLPTLVGPLTVAIPVDVAWPAGDTLTATLTGTDDLGFVFDTPNHASCRTLPEARSVIAGVRRFAPRDDFATVDETGALATAGGSYAHHAGSAQLRKVVLRLLLDRPPRGLGLTGRKSAPVTPAVLAEVAAKTREIVLSQADATAARVAVEHSPAAGVIRIEVSIRTPAGWETLPPMEV